MCPNICDLDIIPNTGKRNVFGKCMFGIVDKLKLLPDYELTGQIHLNGLGDGVCDYDIVYCFSIILTCRYLII